MKDSQTTKPDPSGITAAKIAELAITFLPPLPLGENWESLTSEELEEKLKAEHLPGGSASMDPQEQLELQVENFSDKSKLGKPTSFEILAGAAIHRARVLLEIAEGRYREDRTNLENIEKVQVAAEAMEEEEFSKLLNEFDKKFPNRKKNVSLKKILEVIYSRRKPSVRKAVLREWKEKTEGDFTSYKEKGVPKLDYPDMKRLLKRFGDENVDRISRSILRTAGKKGGKKAQANAPWSSVSRAKTKRKKS